MKKYRLRNLILNLLCLALLASCNKDDEASRNFQRDIVGTWRGQAISFTVDGVSFRDYVRNLYANLGIPLTDEDLAELDDAFETDSEELGSVLDFQSNGTLVITDEDGGTETGTWTVSGNTLTIDDGDETVSFAIDRLTDNELHLAMQFDEDTDLGLVGAEDAAIRLLFTFTR